MAAPAAISGDFCTFRHVQGRKVLQIVIEVPAEAAGAVFATLGMPGGGEGIPVALARLVEAKEPVAKPEPAKTRTPFSELPYSQQAAMRCGERAFIEFLAKSQLRTWDDVTFGKLITPDSAAAEAVRRICGVDSRAGIIKGTEAGDCWELIEGEFFAQTRGMR